MLVNFMMIIKMVKELSIFLMEIVLKEVFNMIKSKDKVDIFQLKDKYFKDFGILIILSYDVTIFVFSNI